jgi:hypothetical protein
MKPSVRGFQSSRFAIPKLKFGCPMGTTATLS